MDDGMEDVIERVGEHFAENAMFDMLELAHDVRSSPFGDLVVFDSEEFEVPVVYDVHDGFWSDAEYADSWVAAVEAGDIRSVTVFPQDAGEAPVPTKYHTAKYERPLNLLADVSAREYDGLMVFNRSDDDSPVVYNALDERFWTQEEYEQSLYSALVNVKAGEKFRDMLDSVEEKVADRDTHCHFLYDSSGLNNHPSTMGVAADGEGFVLGRIREKTEHQERYAMARVVYDRDEPGGSGVKRADTVSFSRSDLPSTNSHSKTQERFARDHILRQYTDAPGEAVAQFEDAYLLEPTTRL